MKKRYVAALLAGAMVVSTLSGCSSNSTKTTETKKRKRSYDPRYAVPTFEERQMMRDADMDVEVSMLELEVKCFSPFSSLGSAVRGSFRRRASMF